MNGADFGTSELIYPENIIINGFHFPYPLMVVITYRTGTEYRKISPQSVLGTNNKKILICVGCLVLSGKNHANMSKIFHILLGSDL